MSYFVYTRSEEELKNQYRKLLIKYDYKSGKNKSIIDAITKEYEAMVKKVRYDNGHRTTGQKIVEGVNNYSNRVNEERAKENARVKQLENQRYTKEDLSRMITDIKAFIKKSMYTIVRKQDNTYIELKGIIQGTRSGRQVYNYFKTSSVGSLPDADILDFRRKREKIEYCVLALTGRDDEKSDEFMAKLDEQLGTYMKQSFLEYEEKYGDPITEVQGMKYTRNIDAERKSDNSAIGFIYFLCCMPSVIAILLDLYIYFIDGGYKMDSGFFITLMLAIGWYLAVRFIYRGLKTRRQNYQRIRTTAKQQELDRQGNATHNFIKVILRIFGL